jgi:hypothetical protein
MGSSDSPFFSFAVPAVPYGDKAPTQISFSASVADSQTTENSFFANVYPPLDGLWEAAQSGAKLNPNWQLLSGADLNYQVFYADIFDPSHWTPASVDPNSEIDLPDENFRITKIVVTDPAGQILVKTDATLPPLYKDIGTYLFSTLAAHTISSGGSGGYKRYYRNPITHEYYGITWPSVYGIPYPDGAALGVQGYFTVDQLEPTYRNIVSYPLYNMLGGDPEAIWYGGGTYEPLIYGASWHGYILTATVFDSNQNSQFVVEGDRVYCFNLVNGGQAWNSGFYPYNNTFDYLVFNGNTLEAKPPQNYLATGSKAYDPVNKLVFTTRGWNWGAGDVYPEISIIQYDYAVTKSFVGIASWPGDPAPAWWNLNQSFNLWYNGTTQQVIMSGSGQTFAIDGYGNLSTPIDPIQPSQANTTVVTLADGTSWVADNWSMGLYYNWPPSAIPPPPSGHAGYIQFFRTVDYSAGIAPTDGDLFGATITTYPVSVSYISPGVIKFTESSVSGRNTTIYERQVNFTFTPKVSIGYEGPFSVGFDKVVDFTSNFYRAYWSPKTKAKYYLLQLEQGQELSVNMDDTLNNIGFYDNCDAYLFRDPYLGGPIVEGSRGLHRWSVENGGYYFLEISNNGPNTSGTFLDSLPIHIRISAPPTPIPLIKEVTSDIVTLNTSALVGLNKPSPAILFSIDLTTSDQVVWKFTPITGSSVSSMMVYQQSNGTVVEYYSKDFNGANEAVINNSQPFIPPQDGTYLVELDGLTDGDSFQFLATHTTVIPPTRLSFPFTYNGTITDGQQDSYGSYCNYFIVTAPSDGDMVLDLVDSNGSGWPIWTAMTLFDTSGNMLVDDGGGGGEMYGNDRHIEYTTGPGVDYIIEVLDRRGNYGRNYTLSGVMFLTTPIVPIPMSIPDSVIASITDLSPRSKINNSFKATYYSITPDSDMTVQVDADSFGAGYTLQLAVYDSTLNNQIVLSDNGSTNQVLFTAAAGIEYIIVAGNTNAADVFNFNLSTSALPPPPPPTRITPTCTVVGNLSSSSARAVTDISKYADFYIFTAPADCTGTFDTVSTNQYDTMLYLYDSTGTVQLTMNDDYNGVYNSHFTYALTGGTDYIVMMTSYDTNVTGDYTLTVTLPGPTITQQPHSDGYSAAIGANLNWSVSGIGSGTLQYSWQSRTPPETNWTNIGNSSSVAIQQLDVAQEVQVTITDSISSVTSDIIQIPAGTYWTAKATRLDSLPVPMMSASPQLTGVPSAIALVGSLFTFSYEVDRNYATDITVTAQGQTWNSTTNIYNVVIVQGEFIPTGPVEIEVTVANNP